MQARATAESKVYCLVNVGLPKGEKQQEVMDKVMAYAQQESLEKAQVVDFKNSLLAEAAA